VDGSTREVWLRVSGPHAEKSEVLIRDRTTSGATLASRTTQTSRSLRLLAGTVIAIISPCFNLENAHLRPVSTSLAIMGMHTAV
jgi:hypothetical protein